MTRTIALAILSFVATSAGGMAHAQDKAASTPVRAQPHPADATFAAWDKDHNGVISRQEFRDGWQQARQALQVQARLRQQFATLDADKSGAIEASEYNNLLLIKQAGKSAPPLSRFDANKDGKLQRAEYMQLVAVLGPQEAGNGKQK